MGSELGGQQPLRLTRVFQLGEDLLAAAAAHPAIEEWPAGRGLWRRQAVARLPPLANGPSGAAVPGTQSRPCSRSLATRPASGQGILEAVIATPARSTDKAKGTGSWWSSHPGQPHSITPCLPVRCFLVADPAAELGASAAGQRQLRAGFLHRTNAQTCRPENQPRLVAS